MAITSFDPLYSATYLAILRGGGPCTSLYGRVYLGVVKGLFFFFFFLKKIIIRNSTGSRKTIHSRTSGSTRCVVSTLDTSIASISFENLGKLEKKRRNPVSREMARTHVGF